MANGLKICKTVSGLVKALKNGENATLKVWGFSGNKAWGNIEEGKSVYLNLGNGRYSYCSWEDWMLIEPHLTQVNC